MAQELSGPRLDEPVYQGRSKAPAIRNESISGTQPSSANNAHLRDIIPPRPVRLVSHTQRATVRRRDPRTIRPSFLSGGFNNATDQGNDEDQNVTQDMRAELGMKNDPALSENPANDDSSSSDTRQTPRFSINRTSRGGLVGGLEDLEGLAANNAKLLEQHKKTWSSSRRGFTDDFERSHDHPETQVPSTLHWTPGSDVLFNRSMETQTKSGLVTDVDGQQERRTSRFDLDDLPVADQATRPVRARGQYSGRRDEEDYGDRDEEDELMDRPQQRKKKGKNQRGVEAVTREETSPQVSIPDFISVENLAKLLHVRIEDFIRRLEDMGFESPNHDHILDAETAGLIATEHNFIPVLATSDIADLVARPPPEDKSALPPRPPIITIMGHVDHGKTTILDYLRKSSVAASEHGGITQHIGAFSVQLPGVDRRMTFLDTPGHSAFLEMRRRGANVTDIVVLVVAADDGVKPQTVEAIKHALDANVQIIVAINKIDKHDAKPEAVKQELTGHGIEVEDLGGNVQAIPVSGKTGQGMQDLEEAILALSEAEDYRAEIDGQAEGSIIEGNVTQAGKIATVLVRRGTMRPGDYIVAEATWARIRTLRDDTGRLIDEAPPGTPVQIDGWRDQPQAGFEVLQAESEQRAKEVVEMRLEREELAKMSDDASAINIARREEAEQRAKVLAWEAEQEWARLSAARRPKDNEGWVEPEAQDDIKRIIIVVKADVTGSVEAVVGALSALGNDEVAANVIRSGVGSVNLSDIQHVSATGQLGCIVSFNQNIDGEMYRLAESAGIEILDHNIIYRMTDDIKDKLSELLPPIIKQKVHGEAEIGQVFEITTKKELVKIAGCKVTNGIISRDRPIRVSRYNQVIFDGTFES